MSMRNFTFVWRIKNFSYYCQKSSGVEILSPVFDVNFDATTTKWRLVLRDGDFSERDNSLFGRNNFVRMFIKNIDLIMQNSLSLHIQISFVKDDKSLIFYSNTEVNFSENRRCDSISPSGSGLTLLKLKENFPQDKVIVRCEIFPYIGSENLKFGQCFVNTHLDLERMSFTAAVEEFSDLIPRLIKTVQIQLSSFEKGTFSVNVCLSDEGQIIISIPIRTDFIYLCFCKVLVLDFSGSWQICGQDSEWRKFGEVCEFPLTLDFKTLMDKQKYLQNDTVTLKCELIYSTEAEPQRIETIKYGSDSIWQQLTPPNNKTCQQLTPCVKNPSAPDTRKTSLKTPSNLQDDLLSLYKESILCDVKLHIETETFSVHKAVLSARSPVFRKMFTTDMREKTNDCVEIPDLTADTLRKLLEFIYTDTVNAMDWQTAKDLYFAADKYDVVSLQLKCSTFLKLNICPTNCCELLLLSDMHQDADLKGFVQDYIVTRDQYVFGSEEWKNFVENHTQLAAATMCLKYTRK